jgi:hypothetical protein
VRASAAADFASAVCRRWFPKYGACVTHTDRLGHPAVSPKGNRRMISTPRAWSLRRRGAFVPQSSVTRTSSLPAAHQPFRRDPAYPPPTSIQLCPGAATRVGIELPVLGGHPAKHRATPIRTAAIIRGDSRTRWLSLFVTVLHGARLPGASDPAADVGTGLAAVRAGDPVRYFTGARIDHV